MVTDWQEFILHWIDRKNLLFSIEQIDKMLKEDGYLIIGDFQIPFNIKNRYHHIKNTEVFTFKCCYKEIFKQSGCYLEIASFSFNHDEKVFKNIDLNNYFVISLLRKQNLYINLE